MAQDRSDKNIDWEVNHVIILEAFQEYMKNHEKRPTNQKLADLTGLHKNTIINHLRELGKVPMGDRFASLRLKTGDVLDACAKHGEDGGQGGAAYAKLYLQVMEGFSEKKEIEHSGSLSGLSDEELKKHEQELKDILEDDSSE